MLKLIDCQFLVAEVFTAAAFIRILYSSVMTSDYFFDLAAGTVNNCKYV